MSGTLSAGNVIVDSTTTTNILVTDTWKNTAGRENFGAKAWVVFDAVNYNPAQILESENVSSITDNGTGNFTINFSTPMLDTNYAIAGTAGRGHSSQSDSYLTIPYNGILTTSSVQVYTRESTGGDLYNYSHVSVVIFR